MNAGTRIGAHAGVWHVQRLALVDLEQSLGYVWGISSGCAYHPPHLPRTNCLDFAHPCWDEAVQRVCSSCPPTPPPIPEPHEFAHLVIEWAGSVERVCLSSPPPPAILHTLAGMKQFSGCAYHAHPTPPHPTPPHPTPPHPTPPHPTPPHPTPPHPTTKFAHSVIEQAGMPACMRK